MASGWKTLLGIFKWRGCSALCVETGRAAYRGELHLTFTYAALLKRGRQVCEHKVSCLTGLYTDITCLLKKRRVFGICL